MKVINYIRFLKVFTFSFKKLFLIIAISISSGIILLSISTLESIKPYVKKLFSQLNAGIIQIDFDPKNDQIGLNDKDIFKLKKAVHINDICGYETEAPVEISYKNNRAVGQALYIPENFLKITNFNILAGRHLKKIDFLSNNKVCLVGFELYKKLNPKIRDYITIKDVKYKVIGVINRKIDYAMDRFLNYSILIPSFKKKSFYKDILLSTDEGFLKNTYLSVLYYIKQCKKFTKEEFHIFSLEPFIKWKKSQLRLWAVGGIIVSTIISILASIGIWTIFSTEVNIRKKEIGILRSIGAKRKDIFLQFVIEGIFVGLIGWGLGITFSLLGLPYLSSYYKIFIYPSMNGIVISFLMVNLFIILGIIPPARKASSIYPQEVLRYE